MRLYVIPAGALGALAIVCIYPADFGIRPCLAEYLTRLRNLRAEIRPAYQFVYVWPTPETWYRGPASPAVRFGDRFSAVGARSAALGRLQCGTLLAGMERVAGQVGFRFRSVEIGSCYLSRAMRAFHTR
jgi:hypothetical protein